jgi:hypothetical protein
VTKPLFKVVLREMQQVTARLVESGLADDFNMAYAADRGGHMVVESCEIDYASMLKDRSYADLYTYQRDLRAFAVKMLDGALVQMVYEFKSGRLIRSRLAYLPSPDLLDYDNNTELYDEDSIFADIVEVRGPIIPLRFDFDVRPGVQREQVHPASHLTFASFKDCRIAATGPLAPWLFMDFVLRSFYSRGLSKLDPAAPTDSHRMAATITAGEADLVHIGVPVRS